MRKKEIKQAVILAGGKGTRLRPLTNNCPKPMVRVAGKPFVEYMVEVLKKSGIEEIVFLVGYLSEKITEYFGDGSRFGIRIKYSTGSIEDDTGTRIQKAKQILDKNFFLIYGDVYWPHIERQEMSDFFYDSGKQGLMVVCDKGESGPNVWIDEENNVLEYTYGPEAKNSKCNWVETGVFIMNHSMVEDISKQNNVNLNATILPGLVAKKELAAWKTDKEPDTITSPEHVSEFEKKIGAIRAS